MVSKNTDLLCMNEEANMMGSLPFRRLSEGSVCILMLTWMCLESVTAQETKSALEAERKQLELDIQRLELEKKELELRRKQLEIEETAREELRIKETEKTLAMELRGDVLFDFDQAEIKPEAEQTLDKVGSVIAQFPEVKVLIEGHTDSKGSRDVNLALSKRRAEVVKEWLVKNKGTPASIITTTGFGETEPVTPNTNPDGSDNPQGRQQNRRVDITVEKP
jgi:outer membrane protein OmpA-like peptidoglycan-associated protein